MFGSISRKTALATALALLVVWLYPGIAFADNGADLEAGELTIQADNIASGTWGTCPWEISSDGVLTIHPGEGGQPKYNSRISMSTNEWADYATDVKKVVFTSEGGKKVVAKRCDSLLAYLWKAESVDLSGLDTSEATDMSEMFHSCAALTSIDLSALDTSKVTDMSKMFENCNHFATIDLSPLDTSNVTTLFGMFEDCSRLETIDLSVIDTSKTTDMSFMFFRCIALESISFGPHFDTSNVTRADHQFGACNQLEHLDLTSFNTSNMTSMSGMFSGCWHLKDLDLSGFDTSNVTDMRDMFFACSDMEALDISSFDTSNVTDMLGMFGACTVLKTVYVGDSWTVENVTQGNSMFKKSPSIIGGNGTVFDEAHIDVEYARVDSDEAPGYLTYKAPSHAMHRLYNPYSGEHFYTADESERDEVAAAGWEYEGVGWTAPNAGDPVYRVYNPYAGDHHYTLDVEERDGLVAAGWTDEGVGWRSDPGKAVPLYREYNPNMFSCNHNYTADRAEHDSLVSIGWADEGEAWYGV